MHSQSYQKGSFDRITKENRQCFPPLTFIVLQVSPKQCLGKVLLLTAFFGHYYLKGNLNGLQCPVMYWFLRLKSVPLFVADEGMNVPGQFAFQPQQHFSYFTTNLENT